MKYLRLVKYRWKQHGLQQLEHYVVLKVRFQKLFTHILVDLMENESRRKLNEEVPCWSSKLFYFFNKYIHFWTPYIILEMEENEQIQVYSKQPPGDIGASAMIPLRLQSLVSFPRKKRIPLTFCSLLNFELTCVFALFSYFSGGILMRFPLIDPYK